MHSGLPGAAYDVKVVMLPVFHVRLGLEQAVAFVPLPEEVEPPDDPEPPAEPPDVPERPVDPDAPADPMPPGAPELWLPDPPSFPAPEHPHSLATARATRLNEATSESLRSMDFLLLRRGSRGCKVKADWTLEG
jgi:hypothetical protein